RLEVVRQLAVEGGSRLELGRAGLEAAAQAVHRICEAIAGSAGRQDAASLAHPRCGAAGPAPTGHGSGLLRNPPLASPRAALRAVDRAAGPRRAVSDGPAGAGPAASRLGILSLPHLAGSQIAGQKQRADRLGVYDLAAADLFERGLEWQALDRQHLVVV